MNYYGGFPQRPQSVPAGFTFPTGMPASMGIPATPGMTTAPGGSTVPGLPTPPGQLPIEQSFIENILRLNLGKNITLYMTYENNSQWNAKIFKGRLEAAGRDHIIISDEQTGVRTLLLMVNLDYATFEGPLQYHPTFTAQPFQPSSR